MFEISNKYSLYQPIFLNIHNNVKKKVETHDDVPITDT
jgi:hypothetical protein